MTKWIQQFYGEQTCKKDARKCKNKLLLGICFGCQAIATALGGSVSTVNPQLGFIFGVESVVPNERFYSSILAHTIRGEQKDSEQDIVLNMFTSHGDEVTTLPKEAQLLASSSSSPIELFSVGNQILCIQGHPEFDEECMRIIEPAVQTKMTESQKQLAQASLLERKPNSDILQKILYNFLSQAIDN